MNPGINIGTVVSLGQRLFDANARIEGIWPLPNAEPPEWMLEAVEFDERLPDGLTKFVKGWSEAEISALFDGDCPDASEAWYELMSGMHRAGKSGFLLRASVPVYTATGRGGASFSWGHTNLGVFFGASVDEALDAAISWAEAKYAKAVATQ